MLYSSSYNYRLTTFSFSYKLSAVYTVLLA